MPSGRDQPDRRGPCCIRLIAALAAFQAAELLARRLASRHFLIPLIRAFLLLALVRLGQIGQAGQFLDGLSDTDRERGEIAIGEAALRLATG
ncbi:MAG TPA: hypothetical protein VFQ68_35555, partial [Streptosporangiaceae bacterium]|nr:hypothetical protein [Streptosporangiaceae bacterium]